MIFAPFLIIHPGQAVFLVPDLGRREGYQSEITQFLEQYGTGSP